VNGRWLLGYLLAGVACTVSVATHGRDIDLHAANASMLEKFILPAYADLADSAVMMKRTAREFCRNPELDGLDTLRLAFHDVMDHWQAVQHVSIGPATFEMRRYRMQLWPDKRGNVGKHLGRLLDSRDETQFDHDTFARGSVAIQGLSALEQLLFEEGIDTAGFATDQAGRFRCLVVATVTANIDDISKRILSGWVEGNTAHRTYFESAIHGNAFYESDEDIATRLLRDLRMQLQLVQEYKLSRVMGVDVESSRLRLAESWRSKRSVRNIRINIESIQLQWTTGYASLVNDPMLVENVGSGFDSVFAVLDELDRPLEDLIQIPKSRELLDVLVDRVATLTSYFLYDIPADLELSAGMVGLDGD
jgi:hypothetical protein